MEETSKYVGTHIDDNRCVTADWLPMTASHVASLTFSHLSHTLYFPLKKERCYDIPLPVFNCPQSSVNLNFLTLELLVTSGTQECWNQYRKY